MKITTANLVLWLRKREPETNDHGMIYRAFLSDERYTVDFADDFKSEGWEQYDTDQDAWYFGIWVNKSKLMTLSYAEGDWSLVICSDAEHFNAEITGANKFYDEGRIALVIDAVDGSATEFKQDREGFFIKG